MILKIAYDCGGTLNALTVTFDEDKDFDTDATLTFKKNDGSKTVTAKILNYEVTRGARPTVNRQDTQL